MKKDDEIINLLKTSKGQIEGILKMINNDRYCIDVSKQILAVQALLKKANLRLLDNHIRSCVKEAFEMGTESEKIDEIIEIIDKYSK
ncbi:MAG: metal-sensing transcriptional repressor [Eubacteriaceae bacterium]